MSDIIYGITAVKLTGLKGRDMGVPRKSWTAPSSCGSNEGAFGKEQDAYVRKRFWDSA